MRDLVQMIIPDVRISHLEIRTQNTVEIGMDIHGVRFDVFAVDQEGPAFTVEMQVANKDNLSKRIRYYQSLADTQLLEKGENYNELSNSYVIMICPFDLFDKGLHRYTFTCRCKEDFDLELNDGSINVILNATGTVDDVDEKLKAFLDYVAGKQSDDEYVRRVNMAVEEAKMNAEWRREYIVCRQHDMEKIREGREEAVQAMIEIIKEYGGSSEEAVKKLEDKMGMKPEKAREMVERLW